MKYDLSSQSLEGLRRCVRPEFAGMPAEELEEVIDSSISGMPAGIIEDFMKTLGSLGKAVGPTLQRAVKVSPQQQVHLRLW